MELNSNKHNFWSKMPVSNKTNSNEILKLEQNKTYSDIPVKLSSSLSWYNIDIDNDKDLEDIVNFLNNNYHDKDSDCCFIFNKNILQWFLGYNSDNKKLAIGIKNKDNFLGCIFGLIRTLNLNNKIVNGSETNLLCLDKKIRNLNIAPLLIQELTRRNNYLLRINQSIYTTDLKLPNIIGSCRYLYRPINYKRLLNLNMLDNSLKQHSDEVLKNHFHLKKTKVKGKIILLTKDNVDKYINQCIKLLNKKLMETHVSYLFDKKLFKHTFINDLSKCWVIHSKGIVSDMMSCYYQKAYLKNEKEYITNCNLFYYFNNKNKIENLASIVINDCIKNNIDRIKVLELFDYNKLKDFNFDEGYVQLNYYIYNWSCKTLQNDKLGYLVF